MGTSEAVLPAFSGAVPRPFCSEPYFSKLDIAGSSRSFVRFGKRRGLRCMQFHNSSKSLQSGIGILQFAGNSASESSRVLRCKCQHAESVSGLTEDGKGTWFVDNAQKFNPIHDMVNGSNVLEFEEVEELKAEKVGLSSDVNLPAVGTVNNAIHKTSVTSVVDEAWEILRESMVYYCGSPIGTIAANDPTSPSVLNYDQVFIRDFIPSGIAFLLKGEYEIVRNFILYTLQLQSWEKTMDCHSPGQGLMPASFKVRTVPLDGDDFATEE
ncbi:hypothetical protein RJ639_024518, partial [Escallonia herrerae]